ncbi:MAG TPA: hypothetical protein P5137_07640 [Candidatus Brocadiia bacterium]|nr:hypothetical protein [Candidatus Brocadiia bacterium]
MPLTLAVAVSDIYALVLGAVLALVALVLGFILVFYAVTGRRPFTARPPKPRASIHDLMASSREDDKP